MQFPLPVAEPPPPASPTGSGTGAVKRRGSRSRIFGRRGSKQNEAANAGEGGATGSNLDTGGAVAVAEAETGSIEVIAGYVQVRRKAPTIKFYYTS